MTAPLVIRTSSDDWFASLADAYKKKAPVRLIDDAALAVDPLAQNLLQMALLAGLTVAQISAALIALGMSAAGVAMVIAAILDPEPTSKLGLLVGAGFFLCLGGGMTAISILTNRRPPNVKVGPGVFEIAW